MKTKKPDLLSKIEGILKTPPPAENNFIRGAGVAALLVTWQ
jgi:hypothetical protein